MNKRLLITDIITFAFGIVLLCVVQLMKSFNPALLTNIIVSITFVFVLILFGVFIMLFSYRNNTENVTVGNLVIQLLSAFGLLTFFKIPPLGFVDTYGLGYSVCIAFFGLFASRFMFSYSRFLNKHKTTRVSKTKTGVHFGLGYSKNMSDDPQETKKAVGYMILVICTVALIFITIDSCFALELFAGTHQ